MWPVTFSSIARSHYNTAIEWLANWAIGLWYVACLEQSVIPPMWQRLVYMYNCLPLMKIGLPFSSKLWIYTVFVGVFLSVSCKKMSPSIRIFLNEHKNDFSFFLKLWSCTYAGADSGWLVKMEERKFAKFRNMVRILKKNFICSRPTSVARPFHL